MLVSSGNDNSCLITGCNLSDLPFYREISVVLPDHWDLSPSNCHCFLWKQELSIDGSLRATNRKVFVFLEKKKPPTFIFSLLCNAKFNKKTYWFVSVLRLSFHTSIYSDKLVINRLVSTEKFLDCNLEMFHQLYHCESLQTKCALHFAF